MFHMLLDFVNLPTVSNGNNINMSLGLTLTRTTKNGGFMVRLVTSDTKGGKTTIGLSLVTLDNESANNER